MPKEALVTVSMRYSVQREGTRLYATCHFLGVVGQGDTEREAVAAMQAEVAVVFEHCARQGILADVLVHRSARYAPPVSLLRDLRLEPALAPPPTEMPHWTSIAIDPAIIDRVIDGDLQARES